MILSADYLSLEGVSFLLVFLSLELFLFCDHNCPSPAQTAPPVEWYEQNRISREESSRLKLELLDHQHQALEAD